MKVLIVDDNREYNDLLKEIIKQITDKIEQAFDGQEAFKKAVKSKFDLILMDINMPKMNGWECIDALYTADPENRFIIISVSEFKEKMDEYKEKGVIKFFSKPIKLNVLIDFLKEYKKKNFQ